MNGFSRAAATASLLFSLPLPLLGNEVTATYAGGVLTLNGDGDGNALVLLDASGSGDEIILGLAGTTINGRRVVRLPSTVRRLQAELGAGADRLGLGQLTTLNLADVALGEGNDVLFTLAPVTLQVTFGLTIDGGPGDDAVDLTDASVGTDLQIIGGDGALEVDLTDVSVGRDATITGASEADAFTLREVTVGGAAALSTFSGDDAVTLSNLLVDGALTVATEAGVDAVRLEFVTAGGPAQIDTGADNDVAAITDTTGLDSFSARFGAGEDVVSGTRVSAEGEVLFDGGDGVDTLTDNGIEGVAGTQIVAFEVLLP
ncbi:MAG: hypothetical protein AAF184_21775 [Pseudomonadota bacterium]